MIDFVCPECGEEMEIGDHMLGQEVRCVSCQEMVEVQTRPRKRKQSVAKGEDTGLSSTEYLLFASLFLVIPCVNVIVSSALHGRRLAICPGGHFWSFGVEGP